MIVSAVLLLGRAASLPATRRARRLAAAAAERHFPGRLEVISAQSRFPASGGAEILLRLTGDPDAAVRLHVDRAAPGAARLAEAVEDARAAADRWRALRDALASGGHEVHALGRVVADPWIAADLGNDTVTGVLAALHASLAAHPGGTTAGSVLIAAPRTLRTLPRDRRDLPTLLRLTSRRRLAALSAAPYHRASFGPDGEPVLSLLRPFPLQRAYEAAVTASARRWLARHLPGAEVTAVLGATRLLPGRVDRLTAHLVLRDAGTSRLGDHVLRVTTTLDGALLGTPVLHRDVREGTGPLRLPPQ
jgi:hypothetical protein